MVVESGCRCVAEWRQGGDRVGVGEGRVGSGWALGGVYGRHVVGLRSRSRGSRIDRLAGESIYGLGRRVRLGVAVRGVGAGLARRGAAGKLAVAVSGMRVPA
jgi:hypothetical protein